MTTHPLEFDRPRMFHFVGKDRSVQTRTDAKGNTTQFHGNVHMEIDVVAMSFDRALAVVRRRYPMLRIDSMGIVGGAHHIIVDDPLPYEVAEKLES